MITGSGSMRALRSWSSGRILILALVVFGCGFTHAGYADSPVDGTVADWEVTTRVNKLDSTESLQASAVVTTDGEEIQLQARCSSSVVTVTFATFDHKAKPVPYVSSMDGNAEVINLRSRLAEGSPHSTEWPLKYKNEAGLIFSSKIDDKDVNRFVEYYVKNLVDIDDNSKGMAVGAMELALAFEPGLWNGYVAGSITDLTSADLIRVELPLSNRDTPVIGFDPQNANFRRFLSKCGLRFAAPRQPLPASPASAANEISVPGSQAAAPTARPLTQFEQGAADRRAWERWFGGLNGSYREGARYWAGQRSLPNPGDCSSAPVAQGDADFVAGCIAAKQRLEPTDARRKAEPEYRRGWNSY